MWLLPQIIYPTVCIDVESGVGHRFFGDCKFDDDRQVRDDLNAIGGEDNFKTLMSGSNGLVAVAEKYWRDFFANMPADIDDATFTAKLSEAWIGRRSAPSGPLEAGKGS